MLTICAKTLNWFSFRPVMRADSRADLTLTPFDSLLHLFCKIRGLLLPHTRRLIGKTLGLFQFVAAQLAQILLQFSADFSGAALDLIFIDAHGLYTPAMIFGGRPMRGSMSTLAGILTSKTDVIVRRVKVRV
jgi:hypothetical protein